MRSDRESIQEYLEQKGYSPVESARQSIIVEQKIEAIRAGGTIMKKGTRVSWLAEGATIRGHGTVISDEENGRVLVAVDGGVFEEIPMSYHMVIHCTVTWLTPE